MENLFTGSRTFAHRGLVHGVFLSRCCQKRMMVCENRQKYLKYLYVSAAALNVVLNLALIPSWGASGAAAASLITQASTTILLPALIRPLRPNTKLMLDAVLMRGVLPENKETIQRSKTR